MLKIKRGHVALGGLLAIILLILAAILIQSAYLLYAASIIPFFLIPFLPDLPSSQTLVLTGRNRNVRAHRTTDKEGNPKLVIDCPPGTISWKKRKLYFQADDLDALPFFSETFIEAALTVQSHDLVNHPNRKGWFGILVADLEAQLKTKGITKNKATRIMIPMNHLIVHRTPASAASVRKGLQA